MKRTTYHAWLWSVGLLGMTLAQAQNSDQGANWSRQNDRSLTETLQRQPQAATPLQRAIWLTELKGMKVQDDQGLEIGTVDDVLVDLVRGKIPYVIVRTGGGFLGIGGKSLAIPAQNFDRSPYRNYLVAHLDRNRLSQYPETDGKPKDNPAWNQLVRNYRTQVGADGAQDDPLNRGMASVILRRGDEINGQEIYSPTNVRLGEVKDLLVQLDQNRALLARIQSEGPDRRMVAAPPLLFYTTRDGQHLRIDTERNDLMSAPPLDLSQQAAITSNWLSSLYNHFRMNAQNLLAGVMDQAQYAGQQLENRLNTAVQNTLSTSQQTAARSQDYARNTRDDSSDLLNNQRQVTRYREQFPDRNREFATQYRDADRDTTWDPQRRNTTETPSDPYRTTDQNSASQRQDFDQNASSRTGLSGDRNTTSRSSSSLSSVSGSDNVRVGRLLRSNEVLGKEVRNFQGRPLGEIRDVVIDLDQGQVTHVIVSQGGGILSRGHQVALPLPLLRNSENWDFYLADMSPELLSEAPQFEKDRFRDAAQAGWIQNINRFYSQRVPDLRNRLDSYLAQDQRAPALALLSDLVGRSAQWTGGASAGEVRDVIMDLNRGRVTSVMISPRLSPEYWTSYPINALQKSGDRWLLDSRLADRRYQTNPDQWMTREGRVMTRESVQRQGND